jgi:antitoxin (DNA-binding transcriptional repressor) of toxin-antitoxin stability system
MQTVGIKTLKSKLSAYLRLVAAGETIQVTDRGRVVAEIVPPKAETEAEAAMTPAERQLAELIRQGHLTPAKRPWTEPAPRPMAIMTLEEMLKDLDESRSDR